MELIIMAVIAFISMLIVRRKEAFVVRWQPTRHTWVAVGTGVVVFGLSLSLLLFAPDSRFRHIVLYVLMWAGGGFAVPWIYTLWVERGTLASLGVTRERLGLSVILNLVLGGFFAILLFTQGDPRTIDPVVFGRGTFVLMIGGLFEVFLYYSFIHLRLEKAFGVIPAIVLTALIYVAWHAGTQLPLEKDVLAAIWKLFWVGVMYQSVFSLTRNVLAIWPFFFAGGVLIDYVVNVEGMEPVSRDFRWAVLTLSLMVLCGVLLWAVKPHKNV